VCAAAAVCGYIIIIMCIYLSGMCVCVLSVVLIARHTHIHMHSSRKRKKHGGVRLLITEPTRNIGER